MHARAVVLVALTTLTGIVTACNSDGTTAPVSNIVTFRTASMNGANESPVNATTGSGTFTATLDTVTKVFTYALTFTGLSAVVNNGHIHGPAAPGVNSGATINFNTLPGATFSFGATAGTGTGTVVLSAATAITATMSGDSLRKLLMAGLTYVNIHTTAFPGGEIRGQVLRQ